MPINVLTLDVATRFLLFGGTTIFSLATLVFIAYDGRGRLLQVVPWLGLSLLAAAVAVPALLYFVLRLGTRFQNVATPLALLAFGGVPLALTSIGSYVFLANGKPEARAIRSSPVRDSQGVLPTNQPENGRPYVQLVCRNPVCRELLEGKQRFCPECGWDRTRPVRHPAHMPVARPTGRSTGRVTLTTHTPLAYFVVRTGPEEGTSFPLGQQADIGSGAHNEIVLPDAFVGTEHATVRLKGQAYVYYDMSTPNGSYLVTSEGKQRLDIPHTLRHGDTIELGETVLVFMQAV